MRGFLFGLIIGVMAGVVLATLQSDRSSERRMASGVGEASDDAIRWRLVSVYPGHLPHLGTAAGAIAERASQIMGGRLEIEVVGPGQLVAALDAFDAVASGAVDAAYSSPAYWGHKSPSFEFFGGVPFGPDLLTFLAWFDYGGGRAAHKRLYAAFNIHAIACGVLGPTGALFVGEVEKPADLLGRTVAADGLPGRVLGALGALVRRVAPSDLAPGLANETLTGVLFSGPADDLALGLARYGKVYYFPGWSRQVGLTDLMINNNRWEALDDLAKAQLEMACAENLKVGIAAIEDGQFTALKTLIREGVRVESWQTDLVLKLQGAWKRISFSLSKGDPTYRRLIQSLSAFAEDRAIWRDLVRIEQPRRQAP